MIGRLAAATAAALATASGPAAAQDMPDAGPIVGRSGLDRQADALPGSARVNTTVNESASAADIGQDDETSSLLPRESRLRSPTLYPRLLPAEDRHGTAFADRVSISPDGRRLAVGSQDGDRFAVQVIGVTRKATERTLRSRGTVDWIGWSGDQTVLVGARQRNGDRTVAAYDVASGLARVLAEGRDVIGVQSVSGDGRVVVANARRPGPVCPNSATPPRTRDDVRLKPAGPVDAEGRLLLHGEAGERAMLLPFDCAKGTLGEPVYEGAAIEGLIVNPTLRRFEGVWTADGPDYLDRSLAFEMREVAASFPEAVDVYPIETTRSPNTMLLYVVGERVPGGYYVLDRYAGDLDLHVTYQGGDVVTSKGP